MQPHFFDEQDRKTIKQWRLIVTAVYSSISLIGLLLVALTAQPSGTVVVQSETQHFTHSSK